MGNALWLFLALPGWYFGNALPPWSHLILTGIPASGVAALVFGMLISLWGKWNSNLLWVVVSVAVSQVYVATAGFFRGQLVENSTDWPFFCFLFIQLAIIAVLLWRSWGNRIAAASLSWFSITYALFAGFISQMAFTDTWL